MHSELRLRYTSGMALVGRYREMAEAARLRQATGLAGRPRWAAADAERARVNVTRTIRAAIERITEAAPIAGTHLQSSIRTGTACRYQPAAGGPTRWRT